jgi:2-keto-4-pentenoate hydratase/2-oxohepta-3-ene-1,7-dioic acid hydratase in catechol pathway
MIWNIDEIVSYVSRFFTLKMGDIIFTGTPSGVSKVQSGDVLKAYIGEQLFLKVNIK